VLAGFVAITFGRGDCTMREQKLLTTSLGLILSSVIIGGLVLSACLPLPIVDLQGVLKGSAMDPADRIHLVTDGDNGIHYGVINGIWMTPELVTAEGKLGGDMWHPWGAGRDALALGPDGTPHVLYYVNSAPPSSIMYMLYGDLTHAWKESGVWESEVIASVSAYDMGYGGGSHPSIAVDGAGDVHVSYASATHSPSDEIEVRYLRKQAGEWTEELVDTFSGVWYVFLFSRIALGPDEKPVIVTGATYYDLEANGTAAMIRVGEPAVGGGWEVEEIFSMYDPCSTTPCPSYSIEDLSLAVSPSGEKAVGFVFGGSSGPPYVHIDYYVISNDGSDWTTEKVCECHSEYGNLPHSCQAGDIDFTPGGQLYAMFTREWYDGPPPDAFVEQAIVLAHRTETGWPEETLWDNTVYNVAVDYNYCPKLLMSGGSSAKTLYHNSPGTLMMMTD
jgi:hypothetical protein